MASGTIKQSFLLAACAILFIVCSSNCASRSASAGMWGGVIGTGVGAGAGAAIGSAMSNGEIGKSALLGAGIGLPLGVVSGILLANYAIDHEIKVNEAEIAANKEQIISTHWELQAKRDELLNDATQMSPDQRRREYLYTGPSLAVPTR